MGLTATEHSKRRRIDHKLAIMARATESPAEAAVAAAILERRRAGEVELPSGERLDVIADDIKAEWGKGIDAQFAVGRLLMEARSLMPKDEVFGRWLRAQNFGFTTKTANNLRRGAEREEEVRAFIASRKETSATGKDIGVVYAMDLLAAPKPRPDVPTAEEKAAALAAAEAKDALGTPAFVTFRKGYEGLDITQLPDDELAALAVIIKALAAAYNAERTRR